MCPHLRERKQLYILDNLVALAMFFAGLFVGIMAISIASLIGIAGWIVGLGFAVLALVIIYLDQKLMNFEMKYVIRLIAWVGRIDMNEIKAEEAKEKRVPRKDYYAFAAGASGAIFASLIWTPNAINDLLPF